MRSIQRLKNAIKKQADATSQVANISRELVESIELPKCLLDDIKRAENSLDLTSVENDEYLAQYAHLSKESSDFINGLSDRVEKDVTSLLVDALRDVLRDKYYIDLDIKNMCLNYSIGPCIVVSHDRGTLTAYDQDSGKTIAKVETSERESSELNEAIEDYMEKTGHFPSVVFAYQHGDYRYVDTTKGKK